MAAVHISAKSRFIPLPFDDGLSSESDDDSGSGSDMSIDERDVAPEVEKGITTFAFVLNRGVIVAVNHHSCESVENVIDLSSHILVAFSGERPRLYCVDGDGKPSLEGLVAAGSGSIFATYRYDTGGFREDMLEEDAVKFAKGSIRFAASMVKRHYVNGQTGRFISGYYVGADGWKVVFDKEDVGETVTEYEYSSIEDVEDA
ncbi:OLC1v1002433C1 [Oldenlandia corymbosa var. corymbosa]|uniref:OLC1v1002433C1 n=1 Tax=Oldenlandia corymbosa var. corymbosa TaxID=529605 RepID=A0AAV1D7M8_OLDCO|nr:OLC1v1002433C1 [Oldenlandia corymbosa var. corymbosa]